MNYCVKQESKNMIIRNNALVDSSFLFTLNSPKDINRPLTERVVHMTMMQYFVSDVVLGEVTYMLRARIGQQAVIEFLTTFSKSSFTLVPVLKEDLTRAGQIMNKYRESDLDFVDCCIFALAERLNITHICTFDERDFRKIVPAHAPYFTLFPADLS